MSRCSGAAGAASRACFTLLSLSHLLSHCLSRFLALCGRGYLVQVYVLCRKEEIISMCVRGAYSLKATRIQNAWTRSMAL